MTTAAATLTIEHYDHGTEAFDLIDDDGWLDLAEQLPEWLEELMEDDMSDPYEEIGRLLADLGPRRRESAEVGDWRLTVERHA